MANFIKTLVQDFGWIHLSLGLVGNLAFFIGSIFFLPALEPYKTAGVWLFIAGSFGMLIGAAGQLLVSLYEDRENGQKD
ncbi:hypothetical protein CW354_21810 [Marinicaulis flavus]|uniref:YrhK domain-containing protein n=1 Tax=Hyphococcus luteus TaxID=2058213 RepID=A0A2S7JZW8_9PROT|nr:hypothetical protein CW354_21810 [Marinicaulis flavus]